MLISPRPGVKREDLRDLLRTVHSEVFNVRAAGGNATEWQTAYLRWANLAVRRLRTQISAADLDTLVLTRRYWLLQSSHADSSLVGLVEVELEERVAAFEQASQRLDQQIRDWSRDGLFVVADTTLYIQHPQKVEELDLREALMIPQEQWLTPVHLVIPILVVDELDTLKKSKDKHIRWRARHTLAILDDRLLNLGAAQLREADTSIPRGEMTVELVFDPQGHVRLPRNDEEIIDRAVTIDALAGRKIRFLTYDTGQSTRARRAGLHTIKIPQLPEGPEPAPPP